MGHKIIPTIGRVILFNDGNSDQPVPVLICYVHDEDHISIGGFYADGTPFGRVCVPLNHDCDGYELPEHEAGWMLDSMAGDSQEQPPLDSSVNEPESYSALSEGAEASVSGGVITVDGSDVVDPGEDIHNDGPDTAAVENSADSVVTDGAGNEAGEANHGGGL